jgi:hypothetical protein
VQPGQPVGGQSLSHRDLPVRVPTGYRSGTAFCWRDADPVLLARVPRT